MPELMPMVPAELRTRGGSVPIYVRFYNPVTEVLTYERSTPSPGRRLTERCDISALVPADRARVIALCP